jgi:O-acetylhomoserine (thiol)-lyase
VRGTDVADFDAAVTERTKLIFAEVVANPSGDADIAGLAGGRTHGVPLVSRPP